MKNLKRLSCAGVLALLCGALAEADGYRPGDQSVSRFNGGPDYVAPCHPEPTRLPPVGEPTGGRSAVLFADGMSPPAGAASRVDAVASGRRAHREKERSLLRQRGRVHAGAAGRVNPVATGQRAARRPSQGVGGGAEDASRGDALASRQPSVLPGEQDDAGRHDAGNSSAARHSGRGNVLLARRTEERNEEVGLDEGRLPDRALRIFVGRHDLRHGAD